MTKEKNAERLSQLRRSPRGRPLALFVFAVFALIVLYAVGRVLAPFITPILLAAILVTFSYRLYRRLTLRLKGRQHLAAVVMLFGITVLLVLPTFILVLLLIGQATDLFQLLQKTDLKGVVASLHLADRLAFLDRFIPGFNPAAFQPEAMMLNVVRRIPAMVASHGGTFLAGLASIIIQFLMMLLAAYYFYVEGEKLVEEIRFLSPLPDKYDQEIFTKFKDVVDATFRGQFLTALAQGAVTGIGLAIARVPGAFLWGAVAALFSLIPMVGAAAVWVPATIYLFAAAAIQGTSYFYPIFLAIWGVAVVSLVDNIIRPWAMKGGTNMSAIVLFFSILGGLQAFGFVGLILGPLVFALLVTIAHIYKSFFQLSLESQNSNTAETSPT